MIGWYDNLRNYLPLYYDILVKIYALLFGGNKIVVTKKLKKLGQAENRFFKFSICKEMQLRDFKV